MGLEKVGRMICVVRELRVDSRSGMLLAMVSACFPMSTSLEDLWAQLIKILVFPSPANSMSSCSRFYLFTYVPWFSCSPGLGCFSSKLHISSMLVGRLPSIVAGICSCLHKITSACHSNMAVHIMSMFWLGAFASRQTCLILWLLLFSNTNVLLLCALVWLWKRYWILCLVSSSIALNNYLAPNCIFLTRLLRGLINFFEL